MNLYCFLKLIGNKISSFVNKIKSLSELADLVDIFKALNVLNSILQGKNINRINVYVTINAFMAKLELHIFELKGDAASFPKLEIGFEKNQIELGRA